MIQSPLSFISLPFKETFIADLVGIANLKRVEVVTIAFLKIQIECGGIFFPFCNLAFCYGDLLGATRLSRPIGTTADE